MCPNSDEMLVQQQQNGVDDDFDQLEKKVAKWAKMLTNDQKIEHALKRLDRVPINLQLLSCTGVGKAVNALRKHQRWGEKASGLVARWKEVAKAETARAAEEEEEEGRRNDGTEDEEDDEDEDGGKEEEEDETENDDEEAEEEKPSLVIRIKKERYDQSSRTEIIRRKRRNEDEEHEQEETEEDGAPMDAFSAQLAAADRAAKVPAKRPKKVPPMITPESIQNSLMESLNNPKFMQSHKQKLQSEQMLADSNIIMFKAPKEKKRIYAGRRKPMAPGTVQEVPKLFDICMRFLLNNVDAIDETGNIPFDVLRPVLEKANAEQLMRLERKNPYLREDTDYLWKIHCKREFAKELTSLREELDESEDDEDEFGDGLSWRKRYKTFRSDREQRLKRLSSQIKSHINETVQPQRQAMVTAPIAPRHVRKRQIMNGIRVQASQVPSAVELTRARRQIFENGNDADLRSMPAAIRNATSTLGSHRPKWDASSSSSSSGGSSSSSLVSSARRKPQRGPLMLKTLRMLKKQRR